MKFVLRAATYGRLSVLRYQRRVRTPFVAALCTMFAPTVVRAQPEPPVVRLVVPAREGCPTEASLRVDLQRRLGRDPTRADAPREFAVDFVPSPAGWDAWVVVTARASGRRAVRVIERRAPRCADLADAVGVTLAIAVDADAPDEPCPACPTSPPPPAPPPRAPAGRDDERPPALAATRPRAASPPAPRLVASAALLAGAAFGFEATAPEWGLQLRVARSRLPWLQGVVALRSVVAYERRDTIRVLGATTGAAGLCFAARWEFLGGGACLGAELGAVHPLFPEPGRTRGDRLWFAPFASAYGRVRVAGPLFVAFEGRLAATVAPEEETRSADPRRPQPLQPSRVTGDLSGLLGFDL